MSEVTRRAFLQKIGLGAVAIPAGMVAAGSLLVPGRMEPELAKQLIAVEPEVIRAVASGAAFMPMRYISRYQVSVSRPIDMRLPMGAITQEPARVRADFEVVGPEAVAIAQQAYVGGEIAIEQLVDHAEQWSLYKLPADLRWYIVDVRLTHDAGMGQAGARASVGVEAIYRPGLV